LGAELILTTTEIDRRIRTKEDANSGAFPITNYTDPPVGSNPFGVQGYKEISYELHSQISETPDYVLVPTSRGDLLYEIYEGFSDFFKECNFEKS
jgi:threonine synthase